MEPHELFELHFNVPVSGIFCFSNGEYYVYQGNMGDEEYNSHKLKHLVILEVLRQRYEAFVKGLELGAVRVNEEKDERIKQLETDLSNILALARENKFISATPYSLTMAVGKSM